MLYFPNYTPGPQVFVPATPPPPITNSIEVSPNFTPPPSVEVVAVAAPIVTTYENPQVTARRTYAGFGIVDENLTFVNPQ